MPDADNAVNHGPRSAAPPRVVLGWVVVAILVALGAYAVAPWVLPARVVEGPMVQMSRPDGVTLIWYLSRPAECAVEVAGGGQSRVVPAEADGRRNRAVIQDLEPGRLYPYEIRIGDKSLTEGLAFQTARADDGAYTFLVFGDSGTGTRTQYELASEMAASAPQPEFLLHTGDLVYSDGARRRYDSRFFQPYRELLARVNFCPAWGITTSTNLTPGPRTRRCSSFPPTVRRG
jgi:hypothetical protein